MENTPGLPQDNIHFLAPARDGGLWVGTYSRGVGRLNGDRFVPLTGILNPQIRAILESSDGSTWIGTAGGLNRRKDGRLSAYTTKEGLASNDVLAVLEDNRSRLWIGTAGGLSPLEREKKALMSQTPAGQQPYPQSSNSLPRAQEVPPSPIQSHMKVETQKAIEPTQLVTYNK